MTNRPSLSESISSNGSGVARELRNVASDVGDMIKSTTALSSEQMDRIKASLAEQVTAAREYFETTSNELAERARKSVKATDAYVHESPWKAIGIGAGIGLVCGILLARRGSE